MSNGPEIRLACLSTANEVAALTNGHAKPEVRLATSGHSSTRQAEVFTPDAPRLSEPPSLLASFAYLRQFERFRHKLQIRSWVLDSGAFTAHASGKEVRLEEYIENAKRLLAADDKLVEVFALDVIGDWRASLKNTERMWAAGVPAIPCYHAGEPEDVLRSLARDYPKIALGGVARVRGDKKMEFARQCFARVWPARIHGFGFGTRTAIMGLPFHTTDATNWEMGPTCFGRWNSLGARGAKASVRGKVNLAGEIEFYLALERSARRHWKKEMDLLATLPTARPA